jgi:hypothetical protein
VLFSNAEVAEYINEKYESAWKSLRPVPKVSIDFGNGKVINRTLNGNIATFVCTADGTIVDVLAGIYKPAEYVKALKRAEGEALALSTDARDRSTALASYHREQLIAAKGYSATTDATGEFLSDDTTKNEVERRATIQNRLAQNPNAKPDDIMHWLYKDVLHADLDDPYLGLGPVLFASYPFKDDRY